MPILTPEERLGRCVADRYRLDAVLASGGMGVLFEARDESTGERVAVKMLKPAHALEADGVARFARETRIAAALRHPNIALVLDVGTDEGAPFFVMELLDGHSLAQELKERHVVGIAEALAIALPIANALSAAHAQGVLHRDVKPSNIFLAHDASGSVVPKLLDFGIASSSMDEFTTQTGIVLGTPGYMAPEQAQHGHCGPFTDIWGLGAVLHRCITGRAPHSAGAVTDVLRSLVSEPVPPVVIAGASKAVCATIDRALAREPHHRYPSMDKFARALSEAAERSDDATADVGPAFGVRATDVGAGANRDAEFSLSSSRRPRGRVRPGRATSHRRIVAWLAVALAGAALVLGAQRMEVDSARPISAAVDRDAPAPPAGDTAATVAPATALATATVSSPGKAGAVAPRPAPMRNRIPNAGSVHRVSDLAGSASPASVVAPASRAERDPATGLPVVVTW